MHKIKQLYSNLRSSFWFAPSVIVAYSIALAIILVEADSAVSDQWLAQWPRLFGAGPAGARDMLSNIPRVSCGTSCAVMLRSTRSGSSPAYSLIA
jgi:uncharacterized membrane protein